MLSATVLAPLVLCVRIVHAQYSYDPNAPNGPSRWASLPYPNNTCNGTFNSPVAIPNVENCNIKEDWVINDGNCTLGEWNFTMVVNGIAATQKTNVTCKPPSLQIPSVNGTFQAYNIHVHTGSEHSINNEYFDFEFHIAHKLVSGDGSGPYNRTNIFASVGIMIKKGGMKNYRFQKLLKKWEKTYRDVLNSPACQAIDANERGISYFFFGGNSSFAPYELLRGSNFYFYSGGLGIPPCNENVWWSVSTKPIFISNKQADVLTKLIIGYRNQTCARATVADPATKSTSRPVQPLYGRKVDLYCQRKLS